MASAFYEHARRVCAVKGKLNELTGQRFGRLVVLSLASKKGEKAKWMCKCDCGGTKIARASNLKAGFTQSCGCLHKESLSLISKRHGMSDHPCLNSWSHMLARCNNPNHKAFARYGGRGIRVCERWESSINFLEDMMGHWFDGATIERIDVNGDYCKENCRWITRADQNLNKRNTVRVTWADGTVETMREVCSRMRLSYNTIRSRYNRGAPWQLVFAPIQKAVAAIVCCFLSSCAFATKDAVLTIGGKGAFRSKSGEFALVYSQEKSFRDFAVTASLIAGAAYSAATAAAKEITSQVATREATKITLGAQAADVQKAAISADVTKAAIGAEVSAIPK